MSIQANFTEFNMCLIVHFTGSPNCVRLKSQVTMLLWYEIQCSWRRQMTQLQSVPSLNSQQIFILITGTATLSKVMGDAYWCMRSCYLLKHWIEVSTIYLRFIDIDLILIIALKDPPGRKWFFKNCYGKYFDAETTWMHAWEITV